MEKKGKKADLSLGEQSLKKIAEQAQKTHVDEKVKVKFTGGLDGRAKHLEWRGEGSDRHQFLLEVGDIILMTLKRFKSLRDRFKEF